MKQHKMKFGFKILIFIILSFFFLGVIFTLRYYSELQPVNTKDTTEYIFIIDSGTPTSVFINNLESEGLIKDSFMLKIYAKLHPGIPKAGRYIFNKSLSSIEIYNMILDGKVTLDTVWITFKEGNRLTDLAKDIENITDYTYNEVMSKLDDKTFINSMIEKYEYVTDDILKEGIYHPLEGYLFPETYEFEKTATLEYILETMISMTNTKLQAYSNDIKNSKYNVHELLTLASIVEMESVNDDDRSTVAGIFYNRLDYGDTLGSDVTTYYGANKKMGENIDNNLDDCNPYNTRGTCVPGLPIGPIASSSIKSIEAAIKPEKTAYYYFVADKNGKLYFNETDYGHNQTINYLIANDLWL